MPGNYRMQFQYVEHSISTAVLRDHIYPTVVLQTALLHSGTGKTTIVKRLINELLTTNHRIAGFYTEEVRDTQGNRIGFDVVSLDATNRGILARNE